MSDEEETMLGKWWAKAKSAWAWIAAAAAATLGLFLYGAWREEQGRQKAELRRKKKRLERQIAAHEQALERIDGEDADLERKLAGLRAERDRLHEDAIRQLEEAEERKAEVEGLGADEKAARANELLGL